MKNKGISIDFFLCILQLRLCGKLPLIISLRFNISVDDRGVGKPLIVRSTAGSQRLTVICKMNDYPIVD